MKKLFAPLSAAIAASQLFAMKAFAALPQSPQVEGLSTETNVMTVILQVISTVLDYILIIAVIFVIVAGIRLIVSGGEEGEKDKAKKTIIYVIVGIIVVIFARVIVEFISSQF